MEISGMNADMVPVSPAAGGSGNVEAKISQLEKKLEQLGKEKEKAVQEKDEEKAKKIAKQMQEIQKQIQRLKGQKDDKREDAQKPAGNNGFSEDSSLGNYVDEKA